jgi:hypothetical protein
MNGHLNPPISSDFNSDVTHVPFKKSNGLEKNPYKVKLHKIK